RRRAGLGGGRSRRPGSPAPPRRGSSYRAGRRRGRRWFRASSSVLTWACVGRDGTPDHTPKAGDVDGRLQWQPWARGAAPGLRGLDRAAAPRPPNPPPQAGEGAGTSAAHASFAQGSASPSQVTPPDDSRHLDPSGQPDIAPSPACGEGRGGDNRHLDPPGQQDITPPPLAGEGRGGDNRHLDPSRPAGHLSPPPPAGEGWV